MHAAATQATAIVSESSNASHGNCSSEILCKHFNVSQRLLTTEVSIMSEEMRPRMAGQLANTLDLGRNFAVGSLILGGGVGTLYGLNKARQAVQYFQLDNELREIEKANAIADAKNFYRDTVMAPSRHSMGLAEQPEALGLMLDRGVILQ